MEIRLRAEREAKRLMRELGLIISKNIRRRHLTKAEIADLIVMVVKADFAKSEPTSQSIARSVKRDSDGRVKGSTKDPFKEKAVKAGKAQDIGKRNIEKAIAKEKGPTQKAAREKLEQIDRKYPGKLDVHGIIRKAVSFLKKELEGASMQDKATVAKAILDALGIGHTTKSARSEKIFSKELSRILEK